MSYSPTVTIIVSVFNAAKNLDQCLQSVSSQSYIKKEIIVIDGGSTDGTLEIIKKNKDNLSYWISEKDKGISDAFNKGIKASTGDYLYFLGADDFFCNKNVIRDAMLGIDPQKDILICGKIRRISFSAEKVLWISKKYKNKYSLLFRMSLPHQALFTHKSFFQKYGFFRNDLKYSMDYELLLRAYKGFPQVVFKNLEIANWRDGGVGTGKILDLFCEYHKIKMENKIASPFALNIINLWTVFKYKLKVRLGIS